MVRSSTTEIAGPWWSTYASCSAVPAPRRRRRCPLRSRYPRRPQTRASPRRMRMRMRPAPTRRWSPESPADYSDSLIMAHDSALPSSIPFRVLDSVSGVVKGVLAVLVAIGVLSMVLAAGTPDRLWQSLLFNWLFWSSLGIGMVMFAVALRLTNADWAWSIRRFALGGGAFLPISFVILPVVLFGGYEHYFHHW